MSVLAAWVPPCWPLERRAKISESKKRRMPERREGKRPDSFNENLLRAPAMEQRSVQFMGKTTTRYKNVKSSRECPGVCV